MARFFIKNNNNTGRGSNSLTPIPPRGLDTEINNDSNRPKGLETSINNGAGAPKDLETSTSNSAYATKKLETNINNDSSKPKGHETSINNSHTPQNIERSPNRNDVTDIRIPQSASANNTFIGEYGPDVDSNGIGDEVLGYLERRALGRARRELGNIKNISRNVLLGVEGLDKYGRYVKNLAEDTENRFKTLFGNGGPESTVLTPFGNVATDYIALRIPDTYTTISAQGESDSETVIATTTDFVDLSAMVTVSRKKDILMTRVQGRATSRKELISDGDINVSITGTIRSNNDKYPQDEVNILREILEYRGAIDVRHNLLNTFGVTGLLIIDFKLEQVSGEPGAQPYSINAVYQRPIEPIRGDVYKNQQRGIEYVKRVNEWISLDYITNTIRNGI